MTDTELGAKIKLKYTECLFKPQLWFFFCEKIIRFLSLNITGLSFRETKFMQSSVNYA